MCVCLCCTVLCFGAVAVMQSHVLVVHAAVKWHFSMGRVSRWAGLPVTLHSILIGVDSRLYGSQSGAALEPEEQEKRRLLCNGQKIDRGSKFNVIA